MPILNTAFGSIVRFADAGEAPGGAAGGVSVNAGAARRGDGEVSEFGAHVRRGCRAFSEPSRAGRHVRGGAGSDAAVGRAGRGRLGAHARHRRAPPPLAHHPQRGAAPVRHGRRRHLHPRDAQTGPCSSGAFRVRSTTERERERLCIGY
eukprot:545643-Prorocentrum_minimum.AAC.2